MITTLLIIVLVCVCGATRSHTFSEYSDSDESQEPLPWFPEFDKPYSIITSIVSLSADAVPEAQSALQGLIQAVGNSPLQSFLSDLSLLLPKHKELQEIDATLTRLHYFTAAPANATSSAGDSTEENMDTSSYRRPPQVERQVTDVEKNAEAQVERIVEQGKLRREAAIMQLQTHDQLLGEELAQLQTEMREIEEALDSKTADVDVRVQSLQRVLAAKEDEIENRLKTVEQRITETLPAPPNSATAAESTTNAAATKNVPIETGNPSELPSEKWDVPIEGVSDLAQIPIATAKKASSKKKEKGSSRKK